MATPVKDNVIPKDVPKDFKDPRDKLHLNEVPILKAEDLPRQAVTPLDEETVQKALRYGDEMIVKPIVEFIATALGVDVIDDDFYREVMPVTDKASTICVMQNRAKDSIYTFPDKGYIEWEGIKIVVKGFTVAAAQVRVYINKEDGAFMYVRLLNTSKKEYVYNGDSTGNKALRSEVIPRIILNYLEQEGIISPLIVIP